ncbi:hypothetical protein AVEN_62186-1 [Araneus ventricosus]|uniref:Uncharacterized protein n=1 Tax=Araneus ventricosus TaxID=182803 RepID=A0A4Y2KAN8_ARAVE|nr:hypothetical protein AVEN_62186-1 [Araneus ventricosus]
MNISSKTMTYSAKFTEFANVLKALSNNFPLSLHSPSMCQTSHNWKIRPCIMIPDFPILPLLQSLYRTVSTKDRARAEQLKNVPLLNMKPGAYKIVY